MACSGCLITYSGMVVQPGLIDQNIAINGALIAGSGSTMEQMGALHLILGGNDGDCAPKGSGDADTECIANDDCSITVSGLAYLGLFFTSHPTGWAQIIVKQGATPIFTSPALTSGTIMPYQFPIFDQEFSCGSEITRTVSVVGVDGSDIWLFNHQTPMGCSECISI